MRKLAVTISKSSTLAAIMQPQQEVTARARIEKGGIEAVYGFSAGAYTADRLQKQFPNLEYIKVGAPGAPGDIELPGIRHLDLPGALAGK
jgi:hypothetical protein